MTTSIGTVREWLSDALIPPERKTSGCGSMSSEDAIEGNAIGKKTRSKKLLSVAFMYDELGSQILQIKDSAKQALLLLLKIIPDSRLLVVCLRF